MNKVGYLQITCTAVLINIITSCMPTTNPIENVLIDEDQYRVKWLFREPFDENWEKHWVVEGDSITTAIKDNKLYVDDYKGATIWNVNEYPENLMIRFKVEGEMRENNKTNFNVITHAKGTDGAPLVIGTESGRIGQYKLYHIFPNYLVTFVYKWTRVRKNSGFRLLSEKPMSSAVDEIYEIVFTVNNGVLRYYINGEKVHEVNDGAPLPGGKVGLRTWNTAACWYDVEIAELLGV